MTLKDVFTKIILEKGYDGLYNEDGDCACTFDDLAPCGVSIDGILECSFGYKAPCNCGEHDWHIVEEKPKDNE